MNNNQGNKGDGHETEFHSSGESLDGRVGAVLRRTGKRQLRMQKTR
jgi:hypothetical protein